MNAALNRVIGNWERSGQGEFSYQEDGDYNAEEDGKEGNTTSPHMVYLAAWMKDHAAMMVHWSDSVVLLIRRHTFSICEKYLTSMDWSSLPRASWILVLHVLMERVVPSHQ